MTWLRELLRPLPPAGFDRAHITREVEFREVEARADAVKTRMRVLRRK